LEIVEKLLWLLRPEGIQWLTKTGGLPPAIQRFVPGFDLARQIDEIAIVVVALSLLPVVWTVRRERRERQRLGPGKEAAAGEATP
jgi:hypothetical protein